MKKFFTIRTFILILMLSLLVSACGAAAAPSWAGVTVKDDMVYVAYSSSVTGLTVANGQAQSVFPSKVIRGAMFQAPPAFSQAGEMIVGGYNKILYGVSSTNELLWEYKQARNSYIAGVVIHNGVVYAPNADGTLFALDLEKLKAVDNQSAAIWTFKSKYGLWAAPVIAANRLYLAAMDHHVYCLDAITGEVIWKTEDLGGALVSTPTLGSDGRLYVGTLGSEVLSLSTENGIVLDRFKAGGWVWSAPVLEAGHLYFGDLDGNLYAIDAQSFEPTWKITLDGQVAKNSLVGQPLILDGKIYIGSETGNFFIINQEDGKILDTRTIGGNIYASPVLAGDLILLAPSTAGSYLVAVNRDGIVQWSYPPPKQ